MNQQLEPGQSTSVSLIATKNMTEDDTKTYTNKVTIKEMTNAYQVQDNKLEDNTSQAEIIISISTGLVMYLSIGILVVIVIGIGIFLISKYGITKIGKISLFIAIFSILLINQGNVYGRYNEYLIMHYETTFKWAGHPGPSDSHDFYGGPANKGGYCQSDGSGAHGTETACATSTGYANYVANHGIDAPRAGIIPEFDRYLDDEQQGPSVRITSSNNRTPVTFKAMGDYNLYGPFTVSYRYSGDCDRKYPFFDVKDGAGRTITGYATCNASGTPITVNTSYSSSATFYIRIPTYKCVNGVSRVIFGAYADGTYRKEETLYAPVQYKPSPDDGCQPVSSKAKIYVGTAVTEEEETASDIISWTNINGGIEITKQDSKTGKKLSGVTINIAGIGSRTTDSNGRIYLENITSKTYSITETATPHYGYYAEAKATGIVKGAVANVVMNNIKHVGNLRIVKRDNDNANVTLPNVTFKIKNAKGQYIIAVNTGRCCTKTSNTEVLP